MKKLLFLVLIVFAGLAAGYYVLSFEGRAAKYAPANALLVELCAHREIKILEISEVHGFTDISRATLDCPDSVSGMKVNVMTSDDLQVGDTVEVYNVSPGTGLPSGSLNSLELWARRVQ